MNPFRQYGSTSPPSGKSCGPRKGKPRHPASLPFVRSALAAVLIFGPFLWASLIGMPAASADENLLRGPRKTIRTGTASADPADERRGITEEIASAPVIFYQKFLGSSWGRRCPSYPSCSHYALLAIRKHGAVVGLVMTFDRFQHEANEIRYASLVRTEGGIKVYDPLENNDYWWYIPHH